MASEYSARGDAELCIITEPPTMLISSWAHSPNHSPRWERQAHLWEITHYALDNFRAMGLEIGHTSTPIIPLFIRDDYKTFQVTHDLLEEGVFVNPVVSPAVAPHDTLIRYSLMATHTKEQVTRSIEAIEKVFRKNGLLGNK